jgi:IS30 family transposase
MTYRQLTLEQRYLIYKLRKEGYAQKRIAELIRVHPSTVSRELRRNISKKSYRPKLAHRQAISRRVMPRIEKVLVPGRKALIRHYLRKGWSPDQIAGRFRIKDRFNVSYQTIYRYLYEDRRSGGELYKNLRQRGVKYRRRYVGGGPIAGRRFIEERPACVERRERLGDWELDTIVSSRGAAAIVTMVDRASQLLLMQKVERMRSRDVAYALIACLGKVKSRVHTLTSDNGSEFAAHVYVAKKLQADFYFARPYKPWQRGLNEKTNGLIRKYFPKGMPLGNIPPAEITRVVKALNTRPRKTLNYLTPNEIFYGDVALVM